MNKLSVYIIILFVVSNVFLSCTNMQVKKENIHCQEPDWSFYPIENGFISHMAVSNNGELYAVGGGERFYKLNEKGLVFINRKKDYGLRKSVYRYSRVDESGNQYLLYLGFEDPEENSTEQTYFVYLEKISPEGNQLWEKKELAILSGGDSEKISAPKGILLDQNSNIYITFQMGDDSIRLRKYSATGKILWTINPLVDENGHTFQPVSYDIVPGVRVSPVGNIFIAYSYDRNEEFKKQNPGSRLLDPPIKTEYLSKRDANGKLIWLKQKSFSPLLQKKKMYFNKDGSFYLTGVLWGSFESGEQHSESDAFIIKYGSDGERIWEKQYGTSISESAYDIEVSDFGSIFLTGYIIGSEPGSVAPGKNNVLLYRIDSKGELIQACELDSMAGLSLAVGQNGSLYVAGSTQNNEQKLVKPFLKKYSFVK